MADREVEDVLAEYKERFHLPQAHLDYIEREVEDALDLPPHQAEEELKVRLPQAFVAASRRPLLSHSRSLTRSRSRSTNPYVMPWPALE
jgi:hypothetical protein